MSATLVTLAGHRVTHGACELHAWGVWHADVSLDVEAALVGRVDLVINDLTLRGSVLSGAPEHGRSTYRIAAGAGSWGKRLPKKSYANDAGAKIATVLGDAARECGETFDATTAGTERLGPGWTRPEGIGGRLLEQIAPSAWYVGEDGVTRLGRRPAAVFTGQATRVAPVDAARRRLVLAAESIAALVPGVVVDGLEALDVVHTFSPEAGLRTTLYGKGAAASSQLVDAYRQLFDQLDPDRLFRGTYEYRVVTLDGNRANLQPVLVATGMPDLQRVPVRPGVAGAKATLALGSRVLVTWINADPARPAIVGFEDPDGEGFAPDALTLVGEDDTVSAVGAVGRALRYGDTVMMPSGAAATPTPVVLVANPAGPSAVSRVRP